MERSTVHLLHKRGKRLRALANELVPSKSTIARALSDPVDRQSQSRQRTSKADPFREKIGEWLKQGLSGTPRSARGPWAEVRDYRLRPSHRYELQLAAPALDVSVGGVQVCPDVQRGAGLPPFLAAVVAVCQFSSACCTSAHNRVALLSTPAAPRRLWASPPSWPASSGCRTGTLGLCRDSISA
jgi:hypothetical protein